MLGSILPTLADKHRRMVNSGVPLLIHFSPAGVICATSGIKSELYQPQLGRSLGGMLLARYYGHETHESEL